MDFRVRLVKANPIHLLVKKNQIPDADAPCQPESG